VGRAVALRLVAGPSSNLSRLPLPIWASRAIDLIDDLPSAADLVAIIAGHAEDALTQAGRR
jgi:hypothetical protein